MAKRTTKIEAAAPGRRVIKTFRHIAKRLKVHEQALRSAVLKKRPIHKVVRRDPVTNQAFVFEDELEAFLATCPLMSAAQPRQAREAS